MTDLSNNKSRKKSVFGLIGIAILFVGLLCSFTICPQVVGGIFLGILMSSGETVLDSVANPDNSITALVISDSCGTTCGCTVRVDLRTEDQYIEEIWRGIDVCDASVTWLNLDEFNIDDGHQQTRIDIETLGLSPKMP